MTAADEPEKRQPDDLPHLAERLDLLFRTVSRSEDDPRLHTSSSVVEALREQGIVVTSNHIRALRSGARRNPSFRLLAGLASVFHVPLDYFANDDVAAEIQESIRAVAAMRDAQVQQILKRSHGVSPQSLSSVLALLDQIRAIEGLEPPDE
jgi:transcriptional regulator with XRE-family HTH domain